MFPLPMILPQVMLFEAVITSNQQELDLAAWAAANGWGGSTPAIITINSGIYIWSDNTAVAALVTGVFPNSLILINNGMIIGRGGDGGSYASTTGANGGAAISLGQNATVDTGTGYIAGGGGGGGGQTSGGDDGVRGGGGGGAGGGAGGISSDNHNQNFAGGAGGLPGAPGANGAGNGGKIGTGGTGGGTGSAFGSNGKGWDSHGGGGGGGRILPSTSTTGVGGLGGGPEQAGGNSTRGGGGGWGAAGGSGQAPGGAAGNAIELNGYSAIIIGVQTLIYGPVA